MICDSVITLLISQPRSGTTTFCDKIAELPSHGCMYEAFNINNPLYLTEQELSRVKFDHYVRDTIAKTDWLRNKKYISFKMFQRDLLFFNEIMKHDIVDNLVYIKRDYKSVYESLRRALLTGDWATTPDRRERGVGIDRSNVISSDKIKTYDKFATETKNWWKHTRKIAQKKGLRYKDVLFTEVIDDKFDIQNIMEQW